MTDHTLLVDAHTHLYDCFEPLRALDAAFANLARAAVHIAPPADWTGCLLCADLQRVAFEKLLSRIEATGRFRVGTSAGGEPCSCSVTDSRTGRATLLVAGSQIVTAENLEVLVFGPVSPLPDGQPLAETIARARERNALIILPWGFGKWWSRRGTTVRALLASPERREGVFVGDNGGRPSLCRRPGLIDVAVEAGIWNLPGSDPLPFPEQAVRLGSNGVALTGSIDVARPVATLRRLLSERKDTPPTFGQGSSLLDFARNQVRMQLRKIVPR